MCVHPGTGHLLRQLGQHTQCVHTWLARGAAPPFEPPASRAAAGAPDDRGRSPRTPTPVRARRSGAPLWSSSTSPRRSRSPSTRRRRPSGSPMPGSRPPRPSAASAGRRPTSASPSRTAPPAEAPPPAAWTRRRRTGRLPAGIHRAKGAGWERPPSRSGSASTTVRLGTVDPWIGGGSFPAPLSAPKAESGFAGRRPTATAPTGFVNHVGDRRVAEAVAEGGVDCRYSNRGPEGGPAALHRSRGSGRCRARPGTPGGTAILVGGARLTGADRRGRPARPRHGGGRPGRGAPGSGPEVLHVPAAAPPGADRGAVHCRPRRSKASRIPAVSRSDSGLPAGSGCAARGATRFRESRITGSYINDLRGMCGCAPHRAPRDPTRNEWRVPAVPPSGDPARRSQRPRGPLPAVSVAER